jgi:hypothetical protein
MLGRMSIGDLFTLASRGRIERAVAQRAVEKPEERERALARQAAGEEMRREVDLARTSGRPARSAPAPRGTAAGRGRQQR